MVRICSFLPSATETIFALDLGNDLYGVTHECDFPQEAKAKPKLTSSPLADPRASGREIDSRVRESFLSGKGIYELDLAALEAARPDVIFAQQLCEVCAVPFGEIHRAAFMLPRKPEVVSLDTFTLSDILSCIALVGAKCGRLQQAEELTEKLGERIGRAKRIAPGARPMKKTFFMEWTDPMMTGGHWIPELVRIAGGVDELGQDGKNSKCIEWRAVRDYAPDYMIIAPCGYGVDKAQREARTLKNLAGWDKIPAVRQGNVFVADGNAYFSRPGPRIVDGLEILTTILNPSIDAYEGKYGLDDFRQVDF